MRWWRKKPDTGFVYEDKAALKGVGGYEPTDPADATPSYYGQSASSTTGFFTTESYSPESSQRQGPQQTRTQSPQAQADESLAHPTRQRRRAGKPFGCVLALMVLIGLGDFVVDNDSSDAPPEASQEPLPKPDPYTPPPEVVVPPVVEGWQSVAGSDGVYAYDVPGSWSARPGATHGWGSGPGLAGVTLVASAFLDEGYCATDQYRPRAGSGVAVAEQSGTARAARETASLVARHAYTASDDRRPRLAVSDPERTTVSLSGGRRDATIQFVEATVSAGGESCLPDTALVGAIAVESPGDDGNTPVLVVYADQGYDGAPTRDQLTRMLESLRWVPEEDRRTVTPTPTSPVTPG